MAGPVDSKLLIRHESRGRAVYIHPDGSYYLSRHYVIYRSADEGRSWTRVTKMPLPLGRRVVQASRLACRLLRHETKALTILSDGTYVASNRDWVFRAQAGEPTMTPCRIDDGGVPIWPPMSLTVGPGDRVLWGEYGGSKHNPRAVRIYASDDRARSFGVAHTFKPAEIRHVHNLIYDADIRGYWVLVGDHDHEPGIGRLTEDLRSFDWVGKGEQRYRAVCMFDFGDRMLYGTDTEMEPNALMSIEKATGRVERLMELDGSCIYACRFGGLYALTTTVEPSRVNACRDAVLWLSRDGERWTRVFRARKDRWHAVYFQFGSLVLPRGAGPHETILFSGQALEEVDGKAIVATVAPGAPE